MHETENGHSVNVTSFYRWDNWLKASKILNMPQSLRQWSIAAFVHNANIVERTTNVYTKKRNNFGRKIYKKKTQKYLYNPLPSELNYKYVS